MIDPRPAADIAMHVGVSKGFVRQVIQKYNRQGETALSTPGKGGRRNCYLSWSEEKQLIDSFKEKPVKDTLLQQMRSKLLMSSYAVFPFIRQQFTEF